MKLFLDTNVILDALMDRNDSHRNARLLLALGKIGEFNLVSSPSQWTDMHYILTEGGKASRDREVRSKLKEVRRCISVCMMGEEEIDAGLDSSWKDFEDAVVYATAVSCKPFAIITNNKRDFQESSIPVYSCNEFFEWLREARKSSYAEIAL